MGLSASQSNSSYSRLLTKQFDYSGRLAIQKSKRFKRLEIEPQNIFSDCENQRNTSNKTICFPNEPSVTKIHVLTSGLRQLCSRFPSALLEKPLRVCIPSILLKGTLMQIWKSVNVFVFTSKIKCRRFGIIIHFTFSGMLTRVGCIICLQTCKNNGIR